RGLTARDRVSLVAAFEEGATIEGAWEKIRRRASRATVGRVKREWDARVRSVSASVAKPANPPSRQQRHLDEVLAATGAGARVAPEARASQAEPRTEANAAPTESEGATLPVRPAPVTSARWVQHVGAWLMLAMLQRLGLYDAAGGACADEDTLTQLRI